MHTTLINAHQDLYDDTLNSKSYISSCYNSEVLEDISGKCAQEFLPAPFNGRKIDYSISSGPATGSYSTQIGKLDPWRTSLGLKQHGTCIQVGLVPE